MFVSKGRRFLGAEEGEEIYYEDFERQDEDFDEDFSMRDIDAAYLIANVPEIRDFRFYDIYTLNPQLAKSEEVYYTTDKNIAMRFADRFMSEIKRNGGDFEIVVTECTLEDEIRVILDQSTF